MAFHESHERDCPACGARMSATAPKCLNCGRFVDEDDDDPDTASGNRWLVLMVMGVLAAGVGLAVFFLS